MDKIDTESAIRQNELEKSLLKVIASNEHKEMDEIEVLLVLSKMVYYTTELVKERK